MSRTSGKIEQLPITMLARPGVTYAFAYAVMLASFIIIWLNHSGLLYIGRDADLSLWLNKAYLDWARPFDVSAMNPMQGMTSMLMAMNPYVNPAVWVFATGLPEVWKEVISFVVYFLEATLSTFLLGVALGFSGVFALVASLWLAFLLFPPFNFVFGLQGWLATTALYGHTLALSNLLLVAFIAVGGPSRAGTFGRRLARNLLLASSILVLVLLIVLAAPFYNAGMLIGSFLLAGIIFLSSISCEQMLWRLAAGVYVLVCCAALHFLDFFAGAQAASARFSGLTQPLLDIHWPAAWSAHLIAGARSGLCAWGVLCDRLSQWPLALTGSYWLQLSVILGGVALAARTSPPLARVGALFSTLWGLLLMLWIGVSLGIVPPWPIAPLYFYLMMYPFWAFLSLYAALTVAELLAARIGARPSDHLLICGALCAAAVALLALFHADLATVANPRSPRRSAATPITDTLQREIALRPGQAFRGSVATLLGAPGSALRRRLFGERPLAPDAFEGFLGALAANTGNSHDLLDLWWRDIPTLSEYGQGLSKPLVFYVANLLDAPQDAQHSALALPRLANIDVLRALGVRFVVSDLALPQERTRIRQVMRLKDGIELSLYELPHANIAGFSPLQLHAPVAPSELLQQIGAQPALLESEAFVDAGAVPALVPAERSQIIFEKGAVHVTAHSAAFSALLLPVQFSHCFLLEGASSDRVRMLRANLIHTLLLFSGVLDVRLKWEFSFWRNSGCRGRDADDARAIGLP
jgi:hypothetical protein